VKGHDYGVWRRILVVPWEAVFDGQKADPKLRDHLLSEASGILNWLIQGFQDWKSSGLMIPQAVAAAHEDYRQDCDPVRHWLQECCEMFSGATTPSKSLYDSYTGWARETGTTPISQHAFGKHLTRKGIKPSKKSGNIIRLGIRLV